MPNTKVEVNWIDNSTSENGQYVYKSTSGSPNFPDDYTRIAELDPNQTSYVDEPVQSGTTVHYAISSFNSEAESFPSITSIKTNSAPSFIQDSEQPNDGELKVSLNPTLSIDVDDTDGDQLTVYFYEDQTDNLIGVSNVSGNGTASVKWDGLNQDSLFSWYSIVYDGVYSTESQRFQFKTNARPSVVQKSETPASGSTSVSLNPELSVDVRDNNGDTLDVSFFNSDNDAQIGTTQTVNGSGTVSVVWSNRQDTTEYSWYVSVSDGNIQSESDDFSFSTDVTYIGGLETQIVGNNIDIQWNGNSSNGNITIERSTDGFETVERILNSANGDISSFKDVFIDSGGDYEYRVVREGPKGRSKSNTISNSLSAFNSIVDVNINRNKDPNIETIGVPSGYSSIRVYRSFLENPIFPSDYDLIEESQDTISDFTDEDTDFDTYITYAFVAVDSDSNESPPDVRTTYVPPDGIAVIDPESN